MLQIKVTDRWYVVQLPAEARHVSPLLWGPSSLLFNEYQYSFPAVRRTESKADRSLPSSVQARNARSYASSSFACKESGSFTFKMQYHTPNVLVRTRRFWIGAKFKLASCNDNHTRQIWTKFNVVWWIFRSSVLNSTRIFSVVVETQDLPFVRSS